MTTQTMNAEQQRKRNVVDFRKRFTILHQAAIGVTMVRTREPFRAIEAIREFAFAENMEFRAWNILRGWELFEKNLPAEEAASDGIADPLAALKAIIGMGQSGEPFGARGVFVMMHPHRPLEAGHMGMIQAIKEYSKSFSAGYRRLVLLCPSSFVMPPELQDDVIVLDFDTPSYAELRDILDRLIRDVPEQKRPRYSEAQIDRIIANGAGMTKQEFDNAVSRALVGNRALLPNIPIDVFCGQVADVKTEVVKRSEVLELMEPGRIENIGGLDNLKAWIGKRKRAFGQEARDFGVEAPKGIALIGPPGTGKTAAGKAIASVLGIPMLKLDVGRVFQSLVGQSEQRVREATKLVDSMAPCVLLIDEADKAFQTGSTGDSGVGSRVLGTLLTWMQETKSPVFMIVTANRTENLPSEFLRKGRLDEIFNVTTPNATERLAIIKIHLRLRKQDPEAIEDLDAAVAKSAGYVSAEIEAAVKDSIIEAFSADEPVTGALIAQQLDFMVPLSEAFKDQFDSMKRWADANARPASVTDGETAGTPPARRRRGAVPSTTAPAAQVGGRAMALDS